MSALAVELGIRHDQANHPRLLCHLDDQPQGRRGISWPGVSELAQHDAPQDMDGDHPIAHFG